MKVQKTAKQQNDAVSFERKNRMFFSGNQQEELADLILPGCEGMELLIKGDRLAVAGQTQTVVKNERETIAAGTTLKPGDTIALGELRLTFFQEWFEVAGGVLKPAVGRLVQTAGAAGRFADFPHYKRSPRVIYTMTPEKIALKAPPQKQSMNKGGIVQLIVPTLSTLAFTILMGMMMNRGPYVYMSAGMTVITLIFSIKNFLTQRREIKTANQKREQVYQSYLLETRKEIRRKRSAEKEAIAYQYPDAATLAELVENYSSRLYERTGLDDDFLEVTLGFRSGESCVTVGYEKKELELETDELSEEAREVAGEFQTVDYLPLHVELAKSHLGLVGYKRNVHKQLKYLLMQLTFFHSYHDLQIVFLHHERYRKEFAYTRWYPHLQIESINVTGEICSEQARDQIMGSLQQIIKDRKQKQEEEQQELAFTPHFLFIIDEPALIINHTIMEYLQSKELNLGFSFLYTTDQQENLPENVKTVCLIENKEDGRLLLNQGKRVNLRFRLQHPDGIDLERMSRTLSAILHEQGMKSQIPEAITFFEMFGVEHPEELQIAGRWEQHQSHKSLAVPLGVRAKEDYVELNLHEKAHGPHGLVAGTTGSGKSEIVQSYILSLAANFHPYQVGFLLIDYKGGGMANLFKDLPHLLGTITNLDKAESMRAMASIKSELSRRQQIFSDHEVNHINGYNQLFQLGKVSEPLPHLFLISDEFAELKKEQPEFMSELVSAARIGRSLGIHLILATQKPSGVVDDQIWTNSKFKLCLKVQNASDSKEMIRTPDAANITQAGRAYLQVGNNEIYELFQSAWSGATYNKEQSEAEREDDRVYVLNEIGQGELLNKDLSGGKESNQIKETQLDAVVSHIKAVYDDMDTVEIKKPWLPSLPAMLLSPHTVTVADSRSFLQLDTTLGLGLIDIPEEQSQREYLLNLETNGHILYMASGGYGKSMFLGHIILGLAMKNAVKNLHIYIMDFGNSALIAYNGLPHVADYMGFDDHEKIQKFSKRILDTISERKKLLAKAMTQNFHVYNQSQPEPLQAIVIAVDNYDVIGELGDEVTSFLQKAARDGSSLGIYLAVTMTRENVMRGATKGHFKERIAGYNFVEGENNGFIGRSQLQLPDDKKGRALVKVDHINLMQLYTSVPCEDEVVYNQELKALIDRVREAGSEAKAKGIPTLPEVLRYEMLADYPGYVKDNTFIPLGVDAESLEVYGLDLRDAIGVMIGNGGSGRTNALKNALRHLSGYPVILIDNKSEELRTFAGQENVTYVRTAADYEQLRTFLEGEINRRRQLYEEQKESARSLKDFGQSLEPLYLLIDGVQELYESLGGSDEKIDFIEAAFRSGIYVIAALDAKLRPKSSKLLNKIAESKSAVILGLCKKR